MKTHDTRAFRHALGAFATGVTIVTTRTPAGVDAGVTANSFNSVSLDPPMVLWSLARSAGSFDAFAQAEHFTAHVLACDQETLSDTFARRGIDKFAGLSVERGLGGVPLLPGCAAWFQCRIAHRYEGGDHVILVGEVLEFGSSRRQPLAYVGGRYALPVHKPKEAPAAEGPLEALLGRAANACRAPAAAQADEEASTALLEPSEMVLLKHLLTRVIDAAGNDMAARPAAVGSN
jgi:flavin reductase (DIM6/NTAB) family NADH-FMN oxidoreductase RutF